MMNGIPIYFTNPVIIFAVEVARSIGFKVVRIARCITIIHVKCYLKSFLKLEVILG